MPAVCSFPEVMHTLDQLATPAMPLSNVRRLVSLHHTDGSVRLIPGPSAYPPRGQLAAEITSAFAGLTTRMVAVMGMDLNNETQTLFPAYATTATILVHLYYGYPRALLAGSPADLLAILAAPDNLLSALWDARDRSPQWMVAVGGLVFHIQRDLLRFTSELQPTASIREMCSPIRRSNAMPYLGFMYSALGIAQQIPDTDESRRVLEAVECATYPMHGRNMQLNLARELCHRPTDMTGLQKYALRTLGWDPALDACDGMRCHRHGDVQCTCTRSCLLIARMRCSRCKLASYCTSECQKRDWRAHKSICNFLVSCASGS